MFPNMFFVKTSLTNYKMSVNHRGFNQYNVAPLDGFVYRIDLSDAPLGPNVVSGVGKFTALSLIHLIAFRMEHELHLLQERGATKWEGGGQVKFYLYKNLARKMF